jgi:hypothetical protein
VPNQNACESEAAIPGGRGASARKSEGGGGSAGIRSMLPALEAPCGDHTGFVAGVKGGCSGVTPSPNSGLLKGCAELPGDQRACWWRERYISTQTRQNVKFDGDEGATAPAARWGVRLKPSGESISIYKGFIARHTLLPPKRGASLRYAL